MDSVEKELMEHIALQKKAIGNLENGVRYLQNGIKQLQSQVHDLEAENVSLKVEMIHSKCGDYDEFKTCETCHNDRGEWSCDTGSYDEDGDRCDHWEIREDM